MQTAREDLAVLLFTRQRGTVNGVITYYPARGYNKQVDGIEVSIQKHYTFGSQTIAIRVNGTLNWVLGDHLGSTSVTANADGSFKSQIQYTAFGEIRASLGITESEYRYTDQLRQAELGLYYYVARWYDPVTAHFASADTIVPGAGSAKAFDRYAYALNNPLKYTDPSGHCVVGGHQFPESSPACKWQENSSYPAGVPLNPDTGKDFSTPVPDKKDAFLQAVLRHKYDLPHGMTVRLLLAMGAAESGAGHEWDQECLNTFASCPPSNPNSGGVLQVEPESGYKWYSGKPGFKLYNNSATGYDNNVRDAIAYLRNIADTIASGRGRAGVEKDYSNISSGLSVKLLLYYNGGSNPRQTYVNGKGNPNYLEQVADFLDNSPFGPGYNDHKLANDLRNAQLMLNAWLEENR